MIIFAHNSEHPMVYEKLILGHCHGVALCRRGGMNDPHVAVHPISEDDGNWFAASDGYFSSFWLPEYVKIMQEALDWIEKNCDKDPSGFGWQFK